MARDPFADDDGWKQSVKQYAKYYGNLEKSRARQRLYQCLKRLENPAKVNAQKRRWYATPSGSHSNAVSCAIWQHNNREKFNLSQRRHYERAKAQSLLK